jgi:hypothetical protein
MRSPCSPSQCAQTSRISCARALGACATVVVAQLPHRRSPASSPQLATPRCRNPWKSKPARAATAVSALLALKTFEICLVASNRVRLVYEPHRRQRQSRVRVRPLGPARSPRCARADSLIHDVSDRVDDLFGLRRVFFERRHGRRGSRPHRFEIAHRAGGLDNHRRPACRIVRRFARGDVERGVSRRASTNALVEPLQRRRRERDRLGLVRRDLRDLLGRPAQFLNRARSVGDFAA